MLTYLDPCRYSTSTNNGDNMYWGAMVVAGDIIEFLSELLNKQRKGRSRH